VLPTDAIKADGYLSRLQQFWLDAISPLAAILECAEAGDLMLEKAVSSVQVVLCLMGNVHQHMAQEKCKKLLLKLNPSLRFMADYKKNFQSAVPMLFGEEFAKQATTMVDQLKAKRTRKVFRLPPLKLPSRLQGWIQKQPWTISPIQLGVPPSSSELQLPRTKHPRTETLDVCINHGLNVVNCYKKTIIIFTV